MPAAAAATAYLNARTLFSHDIWFLITVLRSALQAKRYDRQDRVNVFYRLEEHAHDPKVANRTFLFFEGRRWTFKESYDIVLRYGSWLKFRHGISTDQVVALDYMNCPEYLFMLLGLWSIGAVPALINYNLANKALTHCVRTSTAQLLIVDPEIRDKFSAEVQAELASNDFYEGGKGGVKVLFHDKSLEEEISQVQVKREPDSCRSGAGINQGKRTGVLIYTSGTTGLPKAAIGKSEELEIGFG